MVTPLNFFSPYKDLPGRHENQLTRALLVALSFSPLAHSTWLRLIDHELRLESLPSPIWRTQESALISTGAGDGEDEPPPRVISVLLAPDALPITAAVKASTRIQVLDGVVEYGRDIVIVIENKITQGVHDRQVIEINTGGGNVRLDPAARSISWQELLAAIADLVTRELVFGAERKVLEHFLALADHHFPALGPYSTLRRANGHADRMRRRLRVLIAEAVGVFDQSHQAAGWCHLPNRPDGGKRAVEMVFLGTDAVGDIQLRLTPADTLAQARVFYARADRAHGLLRLNGWRVQPNYHWGAIHAGRCWTRGQIGPKQYVEYWLQHIEHTQAVRRADWSAYWSNLEAVGIVLPQDRDAFDQAFTRTKISLATPRPGLELGWTWTAEDAQQLDDGGQLLVAIRARICEALEALGELAIADEIRGRALLSQRDD
jgi:hypothetical protein